MDEEASLHDAVRRRNLDLTNVLLKEGADPTEQVTNTWYTPLHVAVNSYSLYKLSGQLQEYHFVNTLLSNQVEANIILNPICKDGVSHLHIACIVNHVEAVEFFAKAKAKELLNQPSNSNAIYLSGYTPLHCAIKYSSVEVADILLRHGADIHIKNINGMSCVHLLVKRLMNMNDIITIGKRTLCVSYEEEIKRLESIVKLVLSARADDGIFVDDTGLTALHVACTLGDTSMAEDFLKKGADVNRPVKSSSEFWPAWTPLHFAACFNIEMMVLLMQNGANILMKNLKGETALDLCAKRFNPADIQLILSIDNELKDITLSDNCTRLSDLLLVIHDYDKFSDFLQILKDVNVIIPFDSPIWPRYSLLHLCVSLNEKTIFLDDFEEKLDLPEAGDAILEHYNCTEDEEALYVKRIELCLERGCSISMKNANKQTPIHLAFNMPSESALAKLLSFSEDNDADQNCLSHLHIAGVLGHMDAVKRYVNRGADVNCRLNFGFDWHKKSYEKWKGTKTLKTVRANSTPLHLSVQFGHRDIVEYLLKHDADVYAQDSLGFTPIHLTMYGSQYPPEKVSLAELLFEATPNFRDSVSTVGLSHLHVAAWANDQKAVDKLLLNGAQVDRVIESDAKQISFLEYHAGKTPLLVAGSGEKAVKSLLKSGANVHAKDLEGASALQQALRNIDSMSTVYFIRIVKRRKYEVESCGMTLLHLACGDCDVDWAKRLVEEGADVNAKIRDDKNYLCGATPLHVLIEQVTIEGLVDMVKLLVEHGADVSSEWRGDTALHQMYDHFYFNCLDEVTDEEDLPSDAADLLLKRLESYDVNPISNEGFSHFHMACVRNDVETATKFLDHGVDVDESTGSSADFDCGFSPLHFAMAYRSTGVAYLLLERGADVNAEDADGNRPLHVAMKKKFVDLPLIEAVLSQGADIHAKNTDGETVLYCLLKRGNLTVGNYLKIFELFVDYGCDLDQEDKEGKPLKEAVHFHNLEAVNALLQLGVDVDEIHMTNQIFVDEISTREVEVVTALASHVWKMRFIQLNVKESNLRWLESVEKRFPLIASLEQSCQDELKKAEETVICLGLTVKDFLSEMGAVAQYPRVSFIRQSIVDKFFKSTNDLRREFPVFCGLLALQYKKATVGIVL